MQTTGLIKITILAGPQGCGKSVEAARIMSKYKTQSHVMSYSNIMTVAVHDKADVICMDPATVQQAAHVIPEVVGGVLNDTQVKELIFCIQTK